MKTAKLAATVLTVAMTTGCATGLNSFQEREYRAMEAQDVLVKEKDPVTGAVLGILPGGGSFYAREPALGVVNLLFWPLSVLWDPISGHDGAKAINYDISKAKLKREQEKELNELEDKLALGKINHQEFVMARRDIERKYSFD